MNIVLIILVLLISYIEKIAKSLSEGQHKYQEAVLIASNLSVLSKVHH